MEIYCALDAGTLFKKVRSQNVATCKIMKNFDIIIVTAVLVWLCYQTAYDQWFEQQATLLQQETRGSVILTRPPLPRQPSVGSPISSSLFLQLTLEELGICLPINPAFQVRKFC